MFLGNTLGVVLMLGSMLPSISEKDFNTNDTADAFAMSVDVINEKIYYWSDTDASRKTAFPCPIDYDYSQDIELAYNELFELLGTTYENETHNVYIDYDANFLTTNRRINFGFVALPGNYEIGDSETYWQNASFVNANNVVSNRGYKGSIYLGDWDMGTINYAFTSYCLSWYCANDTTSTSYADIELNLPYLLRVENVSEETQNKYIYLQNSYYTKNYNNLYQVQIDALTHDLYNAVLRAADYENKYNQALNDIERLSNELENNVGRFIESAFDIIDKVLSIEILPNIKLWYIIGIPLVLSVVKFIIGWFR